MVFSKPFGSQGGLGIRRQWEAGGKLAPLLPTFSMACHELEIGANHRYCWFFRVPSAAANPSIMWEVQNGTFHGIWTRVGKSRRESLAFNRFLDFSGVFEPV